MILKNQSHERFAALICAGKTAVEAYRAVMGTGKSGERTTASRLLAKANIKQRVAELTAEAAAGVVLTKREEMEFLTKVISTAPLDVTEGSPLCQSYKKDSSGTVECKLPDKLRAIELLAKLKGEFPVSEQAAPPANVNVQVNVIFSEERRAQLMAKKRAAFERRLNLPNAHAGN